MMNRAELEKLIKTTEKQMEAAAKDLDFLQGRQAARRAGRAENHAEGQAGVAGWHGFQKRVGNAA